MMYTEIETIDHISCNKIKIELCLMFLVEYSGWLQHLNSVGVKWGAAGEQVGANKEASKCANHIELLKSKIVVLSETK